MQSTDQPTDGSLEPRKTLWAALAALIASAACAVALVIYLIVGSVHGAGAQVLIALGVLGMIASAGIAAQLTRRRRWAQQTLLGAWLAVTVTALLLSLAAAFGTKPAGWDPRVPIAAVSLPLLAVSLATVVCLHAASLPRSRQRYASTVMATIAAAVTLLVVVNAVAQNDYARVNLETLGRFGLSERSKQILRTTDAPIRLTAVYTSTDPDHPGDAYRERVEALLEEMSEFQDNVEVQSVTTEADEHRVMARIVAERESRFAAHQQFLKRFSARAGELRETFQKEGAALTQLGAASYLAQWGRPLTYRQVLTDKGDRIEQAAQDVAEALGSGVVEFADLVEDANTALAELQRTAENVTTEIQQFASLPQGVSAGRQEAMSSLDKAIEALTDARKSLGDPNSSQVDPNTALTSFADQASGAADALFLAAGELRRVAGDGNTQLVTYSDEWLYRRREIDARIERIGDVVSQLQREARHYVRALNRTELERTRKAYVTGTEDMLEMLADFRQAADAALDALSSVDEKTRELFARAQTDRLFQQTRQTIEELREGMGDLSIEEDTDFAEQLTEENIVIIEVGDRKGIVPFEEVWPAKISDRVLAGDEDELTPRAFNGDSAISSKILSMTREPFATILLTHFSPPPPPQMNPMMQGMLPRSPVPPERLTALRRHLTNANFAVEEWNLTDPLPPAETDGDADGEDANDATASASGKARPRILLVLPPPSGGNPMMGQQMPTFGPQQVQAVRDALNSPAGNVAGAVFLIGFLQPTFSPFGGMVPASYEYAPLLRDEWGVDVHHEQFLIQGTPVPQAPGEYELNLDELLHMKLNDFTGHPVGKPLQAQRVLWQWACPVLPVQPAPPGVTVRPVLSVGPEQRDTWATGRFLEIVRQFRLGERITKQTDATGTDPADLAAPLDVCLAAVRSGTEMKDSRIVVLGVGLGLVDGYLDAPVHRTNERGADVMTDPPRLNADLAVNSAYWLTGYDSYIASGPVRTPPVRKFSSGVQLTLWLLCTVVLPAGILAAGGVVLLLRRT
jgi:hypothetical protein